MIVIPLLMIVGAIMYFLIYSIVDRIVTNKRLDETQKAWDNFSRNLSYSDAYDIFPDWIQEHKISKGWRFAYIPRFNHFRAEKCPEKVDAEAKNDIQ